eukprot:PLAT3163.2.p1 GENE.PLAT3163.2~~PLAT3163.2.p1  ORF type:complete len:311 (-),score=88.59 PLAT3163.2:782-1714(-)
MERTRAWKRSPAGSMGYSLFELSMEPKRAAALAAAAAEHDALAAVEGADASASKKLKLRIIYLPTRSSMLLVMPEGARAGDALQSLGALVGQDASGLLAICAGRELDSTARLWPLRKSGSRMVKLAVIQRPSGFKEIRFDTERKTKDAELSEDGMTLTCKDGGCRKDVAVPLTEPFPLRGGEVTVKLGGSDLGCWSGIGIVPKDFSFDTPMGDTDDSYLVQLDGLVDEEYDPEYNGVRHDSTVEPFYRAWELGDLVTLRVDSTGLVDILKNGSVVGSPWSGVPLASEVYFAARVCPHSGQATIELQPLAA